MVCFAKGSDQVQADHIALAVDDTGGVTLPLAASRSVYIEFAGIAVSAAAVECARLHYLVRASVCLLRVDEQLLFRAGSVI